MRSSAKCPRAPRLLRAAPGVFATSPRCAPGTVTFRESIPIGQTSLLPAEVYSLVQQMGQSYRGNQYHLLQMNCNTFSSDLCERLTGRAAPAWVREGGRGLWGQVPLGGGTEQKPCGAAWAELAGLAESWTTKHVLAISKRCRVPRSAPECAGNHRGGLTAQSVQQLLDSFRFCR